MGFSSLAPSASYMREQERQFFEGKTDADLGSRYVASAKGDLLDDLQRSLSLNPKVADDLVTLDGYIDKHPDLMQRALSTLMIVYWFQNEYAGRGADMNLEKLDWWRAKYDRIRKGFPGLTTSRGSQRAFSTIIRK